jgi:hypothetical protein
VLSDIRGGAQQDKVPGERMRNLHSCAAFSFCVVDYFVVPSNCCFTRWTNPLLIMQQGGLSPFCEKLVDEIGAERVLLRHPVKKITQTAERVTCHTANGIYARRSVGVVCPERNIL